MGQFTSCSNPIQDAAIFLRQMPDEKKEQFYNKLLFLNCVNKDTFRHKSNKNISLRQITGEKNSFSLFLDLAKTSRYTELENTLKSVLTTDDEYLVEYKMLFNILTCKYS